MLHIKQWQPKKATRLACGHAVPAGATVYSLLLTVCTHEAACLAQAMEACFTALKAQAAQAWHPSFLYRTWHTWFGQKHPHHPRQGGADAVTRSTQREEVRKRMLELFLSTDGKHTVHVSADTPEQLKALVPTAKALYQEVLAAFGTKAELWQHALNGQSNGHAKHNGQAPVGKRIDTVAQAQAAVTPHCPVHKQPMKYRQGRLGPFWSCSFRKPNGEWCRVTQEVNAAGAEPFSTA